MGPGSTTPPLSLRLFGPFEAQVCGAPLPSLRTRKGERLLSLLALRAGSAIERKWLAGTLWPDSPDALALRNLRTSLANLRQALGPAAGRLHSPTSHTLCLDLSGAAVDVLAFDQAIRQGDAASLEQAVALYRGPLLEGWTEEWVFQERQARLEGYLTALERLAAQALEGGAGDAEGGAPTRSVGRWGPDPGAAAERHLRRAVAADPLRETAQRALMQALAVSGNYAGAMLAYRELRLRLHREMNAEPDAETQALFQRLRAEARGKADASRQAPDASGSEVTTGPVAPSSPLLASDVWRLASGAVTHNLPRPLTSFIGREQEIAEVKRLLERTALLTLTGAGGCGKSRLALQVAADLVAEYSGGVWLVELAALSDPALVPQAIGTALGIREEPGRPLLETLTDYLRPRQVLLLLDNCEHLLAACATSAEALLRRCPGVRILATSREGLNIPGEAPYRLRSLSAPDPRHLPVTAPTLMRYEAARLFLDRARTAAPPFTLTSANAPAIAQICHRLDGIPLAIELAAARVKALPVEKLNERLDDMFRLLTGGSRTALPRQQTLRALIDWSYDLLAPPERALLRRLSVFAGGWTLEAAEAVSAGDGVEEWEVDGVEEWEVLDLLTSLVDKSLVLYDEQAGEGRYRLLETVRQYARDRLLEAGEVEDVRERHRDWFLALVEQGLEGESETARLDRLEVEHDNLRAALAWSGAQGEGEAGLRLAGALVGFWDLRGHYTEGREHLAGLLAPGALRAGAEARTAARSRALQGAGWLARHQGEYAAGRALLEESLTIFRELDLKQGVAASLGRLGRVAGDQGNLGAARALLEESLAIFRELDKKISIAWTLHHLGSVVLSQRDQERSDAGAAARVLLEESLAIFRELGNQNGIAWSLHHLGMVAYKEGDHGAARALFEESLAIQGQLGEKQGSVTDLEGLAAVAVAQAQSERAVRLFGTAEAVREAMGVPLPPAERAEHDRAVAAARAAMGEAAFASAWAMGRKLSLDEAVAFALAADV